MACRQVKPKRELIRVVRSPDGTVEIDETGRKSGRGAYLCKAKECWEAGVNNKALDHVLKSGLSPEARASLLAYAKDLPKGETQ